jgi:hypothetical protein
MAQHFESHPSLESQIRARTLAAHRPAALSSRSQESVERVHK